MEFRKRHRTTESAYFNLNNMANRRTEKRRQGMDFAAFSLSGSGQSARRNTNDALVPLNLKELTAP
jgi:hypothetical protein